MAKKILIVDDEPDLLEITLFRLKKAGYEVFTAINGRQAVDIVRDTLPDLILLDLLLPDWDGVKVSQAIRGDDAVSHIPILLFTASTVDIRKKTEEAHADDYILKPFDFEELIGKIQGLLKKSNSEA